jgi:hypothetical protein
MPPSVVVLDVHETLVTTPPELPAGDLATTSGLSGLGHGMAFSFHPLAGSYTSMLLVLAITAVAGAGWLIGRKPATT